ncbi:hypothetical protein CsSME_00014369 [Camellia sinensis var. sinensis]
MAIPISTCILFRLYSQAFLMKLTEHSKIKIVFESEKVAMAESTGLDHKQINNWLINQRKQHWKPSEDMQFMVMDGLHPQNAALYVEGHYIGEGQGPYRLGP